MSSCRKFPRKGNGVGPGGIFLNSLLCLHTESMSMALRQASAATRSIPEASMVVVGGIGVVIHWDGVPLYSRLEGQLWLLSNN